MMLNAIRLICGFALDGLFGDPQGEWHPVILIGKIINGLERLFFPKKRNFKREFIMGFVLVILIAGGIGILYYFLGRWLRQYFLLGFWVLEIYLIFSFTAYRTLMTRVNNVKLALEQDNIETARQDLKHLVGRDTEHFSEKEIVRAGIESLAESFSDGILAPLFYTALFGALGGLVYKISNTLDSMLGYKSSRYYFFGFASARFDDLMNIIPSRLSVVLIGISAMILGKFWKGVFQYSLRDARKHPSPNAGWPESALAGALGVQLGGANYYGGKREEYPFLGEPLLELNPTRIDEALIVIRFSTYVGVLVCSLFSIIIWLL
ncbi:adenosylcobinamide-phosphate synthase CbiB [Atribacter laminatus]|jgi:adenosylcobinamide-phosphate synthase|nr:adenosylcobinamide-phosphate synthase CbiB [Atribacter laminatus]